MHRRENRVRLECVIDPQELRDGKPCTRGHALEGGKTREASTYAKPEVEGELDTATATREPVERAIPYTASHILVGLEIESTGLVMEEAGALPVKVQLAVQVGNGQGVTRRQVELGRRVLKLARFPCRCRRGPAPQEARDIQFVNYAVTQGSIATEAPARLVHIAVQQVETYTQVKAIKQAATPGSR